MTIRFRTAATVVMAAAALAGCKSQGDLVVNQGVGITAIRSLCPAVGVPDYTGNVTTFTQPGAKTQSALDVTAVITNVRPTCDESGNRVYSQASFDVLATRRDNTGARSVDLPYFVTVLQGGTAVVSKRVGTVRVNFAAGQDRAQATAQAGTYVDATAATLPAEIREKITRRRKAGDADAALDPLADPEVKAAVARATFEMLIGFQLTQEQLAYNATR
ncbi:hypothetical protein [Croceicoccus naphthovorans]|uniref:Uncharacterized protein n=1 Tax=Croceicoccus naphthovorans TaxID=1348774 RepID=A0A0G3XGX4_9SPHN|nr:hypothetical protein [Croceicoccus naphthovorans]AKM10785.1 hypothetical protein AB433_13745 [Croceicoccus naphthovorans]MBB3988990.1 hypothetical protein [Croceicoccus naphthovorans]